MASRVARPTDVDLYVGRKLRERRMILGLTQQQLAELLCVTYQQAHKYEKGINRMSVGRAYRAAVALGMDLNSLVDGIEDSSASKALPSKRSIEMGSLFAGLPVTLQETLLAHARALSDFEYE